MCNELLKMIAVYPKLFEVYQLSSKNIKAHSNKSSKDETWAETIDVFVARLYSSVRNHLLSHEPEVGNIRYIHASQLKLLLPAISPVLG